MEFDWKRASNDVRRVYFDAEPWYQREKTEEWYQQEEICNEAMRKTLCKLTTEKCRVVEVGCGGGWLAEYIRGLGVKSYIGIEYSETAISNCLSKGLHASQFEFKRGSALSKDLYPEKADIIVGHQFIHCVIGDDRSAWYRICKSVLQSTHGKLVLSSMIGVPEKLKDQIDPKTRLNKPKNRIYLDDEQIQEELKTEGFVVENVEYPTDNYAQYMLSAG